MLEFANLLQNPPLGQILLYITLVGGIVVSFLGIYVVRKNAKTPSDAEPQTIARHDRQLKHLESLILPMVSDLRRHKYNQKHYDEKS